MALIKPLATLRKAEEGGQKAKGFVQMGIQAEAELRGLIPLLHKSRGFHNVRVAFSVGVGIHKSIKAFCPH
jgi:hypothetical protein